MAFGAGLSPEPAPGVRGAAVPPGDPLADEWSIVVLGTHGAVAMAAQDVGDDAGSDPDDRRFRYTMTQDRDLVVSAGVSLLNRLVQTPDE